MKLSDTIISIAGNFRCCLESVGSEYIDKDVTVGTISECKYCHTKFALNKDKLWMEKANENNQTKR